MKSILFAILILTIGCKNSTEPKNSLQVECKIISQTDWRVVFGEDARSGNGVSTFVIHSESDELCVTGYSGSPMTIELAQPNRSANPSNTSQGMNPTACYP